MASARDRRVLSSEVPRVDAAAKVTGEAVFPSDIRPQGLAFARLVCSVLPRAVVRAVDPAPARDMPGVLAAEALVTPGTEVRWEGQELAIVVAESERQAAHAAREVSVRLAPREAQASDPRSPARTGRPLAQDELRGDPDAAFGAAHAIAAVRVSVPPVAHCCFEPHGMTCQWTPEGQLTAWCSTQGVSARPGQLAAALGVPASSVRVIAEHVGGAFGSKLAPDSWDVSAARIARSLGRPVRLFLTREQDLLVGGERPSAHAAVKVAADTEGRLVAWSSWSWGSPGAEGTSRLPLPYVFAVPNARHRHVSVPTDRAPARPWRAPDHPQACLVTMAALDDLAAELGMDPLELVRRNLELTGEREATYSEELDVASEALDWPGRFRPRPKLSDVLDAAERGEAVRRGVGLALHQWEGGGHDSECDVLVHPDGSVEARLGSQDLGTGTRTVVAVVLAETFGLGLDAVSVTLGDSAQPPSGASERSATAAGVSAAVRRAAVAARARVLRAAAEALSAEPADVALLEGRVVVVNAPDAPGLSWSEAAALLGPAPLSVRGSHPGPGRLTGSGVGGVQLAAVAVDVETGVVRVEAIVAVQDCGLIVDRLTAESQVLGGLAMGVSTALYEERVRDSVSGRLLNTDLDAYELAGLLDVGSLDVRLLSGPAHDARGVIGIGEPAVIGTAAAIANAVANAIGVRVPALPLTPDRVLAAMGVVA